jgi:hypothetical protein
MRLPLLALLLLLAACGSDAAPAAARPKVAIFGVDGATFDVIDPLLAQGKLPALRALLDRGARCVLRSEIAEGSSPVLWAHIATGVRKAEHGITGFTHPIDGRQALLTSHDRRVPALWNMVATRGGSSGIVGWWNTWPAESVPDYIVSDLFASSLYKRNYSEVDTEGVVFPPELVTELQPFSFAPAALRREELAPLGRFSDAEWAVLSADDSQRDFIRQDGLAALRYGLQAQKSFASAALHLLETRPQPDLFFVFLELPDRVSHNFWHAFEPGKVAGGAEKVDPEWRERWSGVVPGSYEIVDDWIGRIAAKLDPDTTIFVVSDHGFRSSGGAGGSTADLQHVGGSGTHSERGVLIAAGPAIARGATCPAQTYDVAPTVLAALGLPGTTQPIGHVLRPLFAPDFLARHPLLPARDEPALASGSAVLQGPDEERLRNMKAIGYTLGAANEVPTGGSDEDAPPSAPEASSDIYVVQPGDTLADIARRLLGGAGHAAELARRNGLDEQAALTPGQVLRLH